MWPRSTKSSGEALRAAGALSTVGLAFVLALVIGYWMGSRLDAWFGTAPVLTIIFFLFGLAAGILNVYRTVAQSMAGENLPPTPPGSSGGAGEFPAAGDGDNVEPRDDDQA